MGNHVKFARFVLLPAREETKTFFFVQYIIKQLLDSVFLISRIINVSVRVISRSQRLHKNLIQYQLFIIFGNSFFPRTIRDWNSHNHCLNYNKNEGVLKTKTPNTTKTPKLENKDPPYFGGLQNYDEPFVN